MASKRLMLAMVLLSIFAVASVHSETQSADVQQVNPHAGDGHCQVCHVLAQDELESWFTFTSNKKKLVKDFNEVCRQCHGVKFGHGVGKAPKMNRDNLPLDHNGLIACAITCHDLHMTGGDGAQKGKHLRLPIGQLCLSCHKG